MEGNHASDKPIMQAVKSFESRNLKDHETVRRRSVLEGPVDEGMAHLCGP